MERRPAARVGDEFASSRREGEYRPAYEEVAERIVALLRSGPYQEGDRLPTELRLASELGVGRSIVRESLKMLSALGLVRVRRGSGIYVGRVTGAASEPGPASAGLEPARVEQLFEFRLVVEPQAAALAAGRIAVAQARRLEQALAENRAGAGGGDVDRFAESDNALHVGIAEAAGNRFLLDSVREVRALGTWVTRVFLGGVPGHLMNAVEEHERILRHVLAGRPGPAADAMRAHIETSHDNYRTEVRRRLTGPR